MQKKREIVWNFVQKNKIFTQLIAILKNQLLVIIQESFWADVLLSFLEFKCKWLKKTNKQIYFNLSSFEVPLESPVVDLVFLLYVIRK